MRLAALRLRVADPAAVARFYAQHFGMTARPEGAQWRVGYAGRDSDLILMPGGGGFSADRGQRYWKIGITVPDLDRAVDQLRRDGLEVSVPHQFRDIGYLCHLSDPAGFPVELLQWTFQDSPPAPQQSGGPFSAARIGQITLRSGDISAETEIWIALGMRLLSVQEVPSHGFDLHFLAFTDETPPDPDLWSVANRGWLWQRPYTTLEFQHVPGAEFAAVPDLRGIEIDGLRAPQKDAAGTALIPTR
ncbi:hypothetical protein SAMN05444007_104136 [Cribrihabitans marinus]|uniref:VOC domain-containing protein n=1 Tax=Cribrihabitans marinus TaxID=1227549 RepID=A0A1H6XT39_9RHOB|nr:VOC family protein [Cribrihabitans marinus]GGH27785.1 hypothetical protein GCM10010973_16290 [Cribrihabitans marinus]SEJ30764.1 hypothetical protein SAMN05444007_104136 [Cribrihabitans marinus]